MTTTDVNGGWAALAEVLDGGRLETPAAEADRAEAGDALRFEALLYAAHRPAADLDLCARRVMARAGRHAGVRARLLGWRPLAAAAALTALVSGGLWATRYANRAGSGSGEGAEGGEAEAVTVADGGEVRTAVDSRAWVRMSDGSRAELGPHTHLHVRGRTGGFRQVVELTSGSARFRVVRGGRQFRVVTPVGSVTVLGTEFAVDLRRQSNEGGAQMNGKAVMAMAVAVTLGSVEVDVGGRLYSLSAGEQRVFGEEGGDGGVRARTVGGQIAGFDGGSLSLVRRGDSGESTASVAITGDTKILVESDQMESVPAEGGTTRERPALVAGTTGDLVAGKNVRVTEVGGTATQVTVLRERKREGGEGDRERPSAEPKVRTGGEGERRSVGDAPAQERGGEGRRRGEGEGERYCEPADAAPRLGPALRADRERVLGLAAVVAL